MILFRNYEYFKEEIELALIQNACVEIELYSIIASIIRESKKQCYLSVRDVSNRKKTDISKRYYGNAGFPDFVVLSREKNSNAKIYGCIEVKMPTKPLLDATDKQLKGHIKSFGKVLYTNGIHWKFFDNNEDKLFDISLGNIQGNEIVWLPQENWDELLEKIDNIKWY